MRTQLLPARPLRARVTIDLFTDNSGRAAYRVEVHHPMMPRVRAIRRAMLALLDYLRTVGNDPPRP